MGSTKSWTRRPFAFAALVTTLAALATFCLTVWLEDFPLLILLTAVMASALRGGTAPGLLAAGMSTFTLFVATHSLASFFAIPRINLQAEIVRLVIFVVTASGISLMGGARRRAERERDELLVRERGARDQAEAANLAKDRFLANVSHELRNPLAAILSWASLLRSRGADAASLQRALDAIERNANAQARLIDDLVDVARIVTGKLQLDVRPTDLGPLVEEVLEGVRTAARAKCLDLQLSPIPLPTLVDGDPERLQQIAWNLLANAIKFTAEGGRVCVHVEPSAGLAHLRVVDTGQGFPPEAIPHLFERFWQAEGNIGRRTGGLGLGLAIVRHLVEYCTAAR